MIAMLQDGRDHSKYIKRTLFKDSRSVNAIVKENIVYIFSKYIFCVLTMEVEGLIETEDTYESVCFCNKKNSLK